jgi:hypothetical protein
MKRQTKKLGLSRETLKELTNDDLLGVGGGAPNQTATRSGILLCQTRDPACMTDKAATCTVLPAPDPTIVLPK